MVADMHRTQDTVRRAVFPPRRSDHFDRIRKGGRRHSSERPNAATVVVTPDEVRVTLGVGKVERRSRKLTNCAARSWFAERATELIGRSGRLVRLARPSVVK